MSALLRSHRDYAAAAPPPRVRRNDVPALSSRSRPASPLPSQNACTIPSTPKEPICTPLNTRSSASSSVPVAALLYAPCAVTKSIYAPPVSPTLVAKDANVPAYSPPLILAPKPYEPPPAAASCTVMPPAKPVASFTGARPCSPRPVPVRIGYSTPAPPAVVSYSPPAGPVVTTSYTPVTSYVPPLGSRPLVCSAVVPAAAPAPGLPLAARGPGQALKLAPGAAPAELPDPEAVKRQQSAYARSLDQQLKRGIEVLNQQLKQQSNYLTAVGDQHKKEYSLRVDQRIKQEEIMIAQRYNEQLLMLEQAAQQQRSVLDFQANSLLAEYSQKKARDELALQQAELQRTYQEVQRRYNEEMRALLAQQAAMARSAEHGEAP